jgi:hypothetical protein
MKTAKQLSPDLIDSFLTAIKPLKGAPETDERRAEGRAIIEHYAGRLQLLDLELSSGEAKNILRRAYMFL